MPRNFNDWIKEFVSWSSNSEAPQVYRRWCAISAIASMLRRKCYINWHRKLYPNMYIVLVGPPAGGKGTAMYYSSSMLTELGIRLAADSITREALIRDLREASENIITPGVIESHSSLTIFSEEFSVFIGQNNTQMLADLCDWYDCKDTWKYKTKHQGEDSIIGVWVNILGAATPSILQSSLPQEAVSGGLTSRIIFIYAPGREKKVPIPFVTDEELAVRSKLMQDLEEVSLLTGTFKVNKEFIDKWIRFYEGMKTPEHLDSTYFQGYMGRKPTHIIKLCMVLSASRSNSMIIGAEDLELAIEYLEEAEFAMPRVYSGFGRMELSDIIPEVITLLATKRRVDKRYLMRRYLTEVTSVQLDEVLNSLATAGYCRQVINGKSVIIEFLGDKKND